MAKSSWDPAKYKTKPCKNWVQGNCTFGDNCSFIHEGVTGSAAGSWPGPPVPGGVWVPSHVTVPPPAVMRPGPANHASDWDNYMSSWSNGWAEAGWAMAEMAMKGKGAEAWWAMEEMAMKGKGAGKANAFMPDAIPPDIHEALSQIRQGNVALPRIYVGALPRDADEKEVTHHFQKFGTVTEVILKRDDNSGQSRGFAFVTFERMDSVEAVLKNYIGNVMRGGKWIPCKLAQPQGDNAQLGFEEHLSDGPRANTELTIWVGQMPSTVTSKNILAGYLEEAFGVVEHVHIRSDLTHGFVHFADASSAEAALEQGFVRIDGLDVEIRKAKVNPNSQQRQESQGGQREQGPKLGEDECAIFWTGRLEVFRKGHGFLRPMQKTEHDGEIDAVPAAAVERGVYVSISQIERFSLRNGDVVEAIIRPPRNKDQRMTDRPTHRDGETSWALVQVEKVNGVEAGNIKTVNTGRSQRPFEDELHPIIEWTGALELWRSAKHGFLRALPPDKSSSGSAARKKTAAECAEAFLRESDGAEVSDEENVRDGADAAVSDEEDVRDGADGTQDVDPVGPGGVFVSAGAVEKYELCDGDIIRALVRAPRSGDGPSFTLVDVLDVTHADNAADEEPLILEGSFEQFKKGFGFIRPLPPEERTEDLDERLNKGAFVPLALVERFRLKNDDKVKVSVKPPATHKLSATVISIISRLSEQGTYATNLWNLLDESVDDESLTELPEELAALRGVRLHGTVTQVVGRPKLKFGFVKAEHDSIHEDIFFHPNAIVDPPTWETYQPRVGEACFFKVEARREPQGRWRLLAIDMNFHERHAEVPEHDKQQWQSDFKVHHRKNDHTMRPPPAPVQPPRVAQPNLVPRVVGPGALGPGNAFAQGPWPIDKGKGKGFDDALNNWMHTKGKGKGFYDNYFDAKPWSGIEGKGKHKGSGFVDDSRPPRPPPRPPPPVPPPPPSAATFTTTTTVTSFATTTSCATATWDTSNLARDGDRRAPVTPPAAPQPSVRPSAAPRYVETPVEPSAAPHYAETEPNPYLLDGAEDIEEELGLQGAGIVQEAKKSVYESEAEYEDEQNEPPDEDLELAPSEKLEENYDEEDEAGDQPEEPEDEPENEPKDGMPAEDEHEEAAEDGMQAEDAHEEAENEFEDNPSADESEAMEELPAADEMEEATENDEEERNPSQRQATSDASRKRKAPEPWQTKLSKIKWRNKMEEKKQKEKQDREEKAKLEEQNERDKLMADIRSLKKNQKRKDSLEASSPAPPWRREAAPLPPVPPPDPRSKDSQSHQEDEETGEDLTSLSQADLRKKLTEKGLPSHGSKALMIKRLQNPNAAKDSGQAVESRGKKNWQGQQQGGSGSKRQRR